MSLFGSSHVRQEVTVEIKRPAPSYVEMEAEEAARERWMNTHELAGFNRNGRVEQPSERDDLCDPYFHWKWIKKV